MFLFQIIKLCAANRTREDAVVKRILYSLSLHIRAPENMASGHRSFLEKEEEEDEDGDGDLGKSLEVQQGILVVRHRRARANL